MNPMISIIIPVYNAAKTLERCVESLIYGTFSDIEIILVEDCSPHDNSWEICRTLESKYESVSAIQNATNCGVSYTRNHGLSAARGKYVLFVDSDDWVSSEYAEKLLMAGIENPDALVISGFSFIDYTHNTRSPYLFSTTEHISSLEKKDFFYLMDSVHLQTVWNKLFRMDIIQTNHILFNESISMGEDFQFVLDYLDKGFVNRAVVLNQSLYYYIRYSNQSLMGNFAEDNFNIAAERIRRLGSITGNLTAADEHVLQLRENYGYHVMKSRTLSRQQKLKRFQTLWGHEWKKRYGIAQSQYYREQILHLITQTSVFSQRFVGKCSRICLQNRLRSLRRKFHKHNLTIISQNCIGGVFYHDMGLPFNSPTINLFFDANDFLRFVLHLKQYLELPLEMHWGEEYPIGKLGDLTIYFMHYHTCTEALESWNRRVKRIQWDNILVLATDRDHFSGKEYELWKQISFPKLLFTAQKEFCEDSVFYPKYMSQNQVPDLIPKREFYRSGKLIALANSLFQ